MRFEEGFRFGTAIKWGACMVNFDLRRLAGFLCFLFCFLHLVCGLNLNWSRRILNTILLELLSLPLLRLQHACNIYNNLSFAACNVTLVVEAKYITFCDMKSEYFLRRSFMLIRKVNISESTMYSVPFFYCLWIHDEKFKVEIGVVVVHKWISISGNWKCMLRYLEWLFVSTMRFNAIFVLSRVPTVHSILGGGGGVSSSI